MTSAELRQSFLDFFRSKQHTIVPSASLMPTAPNLLFTNAGMNQFVPYFLGSEVAPYKPARAADTQKCIRAGGKHNDLDDVGYDTYHHTFFEMLGNWSFGDYFKQEAISWAWELVVDNWGFPANRLYATVYRPGPNDPAKFDSEAYACWKQLFQQAGLDPDVHIVDGNRKDNFWMMGDTGPCGPCSELHFDLTQKGDTKGALVNKDDPRCIEIWNLVFIQFNAEPDGTYSELPARHVDTGMGFERVAAIMQCTNGFKDFSSLVSNYETDVFAPLFAAIAGKSGKKYQGTLPKPGKKPTAKEKADIAFRVIADHARALTFSIADGIEPGNNDRNYVLRRILRRAALYSRDLGFREPFLHQLVAVLVETMGDTFPELTKRATHVESVIKREEEAFHRTIEKGILLFEEETSSIKKGAEISGEFAFRLYDEQGFPLDLTEIMAAERGLQIDKERFEELMQEQRARARSARKSEVIRVAGNTSEHSTEFLGYHADSTTAQVLDSIEQDGTRAVILDRSVCYAEMGGQVGDHGALKGESISVSILDTRRSGDAILHIVEAGKLPQQGSTVEVAVDAPRRRAIERHHTTTHLLHWALHEAVSKDAAQKGSFVGPDKLTFDFNCEALTPDQLTTIERLVNERILENSPVSWQEMPYQDVQANPEIMQLFGERYPDVVRVVQIGGQAERLDGYSMELCGGTHLRHTGEAGTFRILSESAIAAGVRRIEAVAGVPALDYARQREQLLSEVAGKLKSPLPELTRKLDNLLAERQQLEKSLTRLQQQNADAEIAELITKFPQGPIVHSTQSSAAVLQEMLNALKKRSFPGLAMLVVDDNERLHLGVYSGENSRDANPAGKFLQQVAPTAGGKGGGKPDMARGAAPQRDKLANLLEAARALATNQP